MPSGYSQLPQQPPTPPPSSPPPSVVAPFPPPTLGSPPSASSAPNPFSYPPAQRKSSLGALRKGKGRAVDVEVEQGGRGDAPSSGPLGLNFCIRFTDETEELVDLWVSEWEAVREVKRRIRLLRPKTLFTPPSAEGEGGSKPRRLRLIILGRILPDAVRLVPYTTQLNLNRKKLVSSTSASTTSSTEKVKEGLEAAARGLAGVVREVTQGGGGRGEGDDVDAMERGEVGGAGKGKGREQPRAEEEEEQIWLHCSVGEAEEEEETVAPIEGDEEEKTQTQQLTPLQGFDRLRDAGFSDEDISNLRRDFRERRGVEDVEEDDAEHLRALEEQWMSGMTGQNEAGTDESTTGHYYSLLKGVCIGFAVPFLPLFFFRSQVFSKRLQMAIILGIVINLIFGLLRLLG